MKPKLQILPAAQLKLWPLLAAIPSSFVLYGGTAIALQLGHRQSVDFDFFSAKPLQREHLVTAVPFLKNAQLVQPEINTLNCMVAMKEGSVKVQFLAGLGTRQGRVEDPDKCDDNGILVASLRDLFATKLNTIQMRAESKDYLDIAALLENGLLLADGLGCASAIYGPQFDPATSDSCSCLFEWRTPLIARLIRKQLINVATKVDDIRNVQAKSHTI